jgi:hypothetical protein
MKVVFAIAVISLFSSTASAENCQLLPKGPDRRACAMGNPGFQAKYQKCLQMLEQRGFNGAATENHGAIPFFKGCMQGTQQ